MFLPKTIKGVVDHSDSISFLRSLGITVLEEYNTTCKVSFPIGWETTSITQCPGWTIYKNKFWKETFYVYTHPILDIQWITKIDTIDDMIIN